jgi:hypothetical protein
VFQQTVFTVAILGAFGAAAFADPILISVGRNVRGTAVVRLEPSGGVDVDGFVLEGGPAGSFRATGSAKAQLRGAFSTSAASQNTSVDAQLAHWFGSGSVNTASVGKADVNSADAFSVLLGEFSLTEAAHFRFTGTFTGVGAGFARTSLFFESRPIWSEFIHSTTLEMQRAGLLLPGRYQFFTGVQSASGIEGTNTSDGAAYSFDFRVGTAAPIPEPGSGVLIASALVLSAYRRWRTLHRDNRSHRSPR